MNTTTDAFVFGFVKQCHALNIDVETTVALLEAVQTKELYANESFQKGFVEKSALLQGIAKGIGSVARPLAKIGDKAINLGVSGVGKVLKPLFKTPGRALATTAVGGAGYGVTKGVNAFNNLRDEAELGRALGGAPVEGDDYNEGGGGGGRSSGTGTPFDYIARSYNSQSGADLGNNSRSSGGGNASRGNSALDSARSTHETLLQQKADLAESMRNAKPIHRLGLNIQKTMLDKQIAESTKNQAILNKQVGLADAARKAQANSALANINTAIPKYQQQFDRHMDLANGGGNFVTRWWDGGQDKSYEKAQKAADRLQQLQNRQPYATEAANATSNADYP